MIYYENSEKKRKVNRRKGRLIGAVKVKGKIPCYLCREDVGNNGMPLTELGRRRWGDWYTPKGWIMPAGRWATPLVCSQCYIKDKEGRDV